MFNTDTDRMLEAATTLDNIRNEVLGELNRYVTMNQDLTGSGFQGTAALASMRTTEDIATTARTVSARFEACINQMRNSAHQYTQMNQDNAATLGNIQSA
ncbi:hypothetical protein AFM11_30285 [Mycolicibacterium wolinskyi]|uniref:ESAT-6-like protein n=1 Tax=Mycolicibacterium wolinskyi TaxID=59750 RepID=A0A132PDQ3_9MYCO|nr:WXG100 family type VII secretion target [Mycolicibacterium wolinskyi]KWX20466.1 hypothetical protein AFM11_30285 [Mycolicibacterium wolinskyi]